MKTKELVEANFKGLSEFIKDREILDFYKGLIVTVIEDRQEQAVNEALRMASSGLKQTSGQWTSDFYNERNKILSLAPEVIKNLQ